MTTGPNSREVAQRPGFEATGSFDPEQFSSEFVAELKQLLENDSFDVSSSEGRAKFLRFVERRLTARLHDRNYQSYAESYEVLPNRNRGTVSSLPTEDLTADEVVKSELLDLSKSQLYRKAQEGTIYYVTAKGRTIGRRFPAWQFCEPAFSLLPTVLGALKERGETNVHARLVCTDQTINELAPAEMLAGMPFASRPSINPSQQRLLLSSPADRLEGVLSLFAMPNLKDRIG